MVIEIGGLGVGIHASDPAFLQLLERRYAGFVTSTSRSSSPAKTRSARARIDLDINIVDSRGVADTSPVLSEDVQVRCVDGRWLIDRGDFRVEWDPSSARGRVRQTVNPYSIDSALRILHSLVLAREGGFLVRAASAIRGGRAFLFAGVSGAGKTTIARLAPPDVTLLTDEISYVRRLGNRYEAFGTPFTGELARPGENHRAPLAAVYLLAQGKANKIETVGAAEASRALLQHILFFARDCELPKLVFQAACDLVCNMPVRRLTFVPDARVWELIA